MGTNPRSQYFRGELPTGERGMLRQLIDARGFAMTFSKISVMYERVVPRSAQSLLANAPTRVFI